jgi:hypothetical protein
MFIKESKMNENCHLTEITLKGKQARIYDNCLPLDVFRKMKDIMLSGEFPWFYNDAILYGGEFESPLDGYDNDNTVYQFTHTFFMGGFQSWPPSTEVIVPILDILNPRSWIRVKANLNPIGSDHLVSGWHYDMGGMFEDGTMKPYDDSTTAVLYMNTNNGYTLMETGDKVESVENRLVLFPNDILHTGITQTDTKIRVLLNFNFFENKNEGKKHFDWRTLNEK